MWVITRAINQYDQDGEYFVAVYDKLPSTKQIMSIVRCNEKYAQHILSGGGRIGVEPEWHYLTQLDSGQIYIHHSGGRGDY